MKDFDDKLEYRAAMLIGKSARAIWVVVLTIILIVTVMYGVVLNAFDSQPVAILVSIILLSVITFLSMSDIRDEKRKFDSVKNGSPSVSRASSRKK